MANTVLITGGAGFIGSCLVRQLLTEDRTTHVVNLDKLTYAGNLDSLESLVHHPRHQFVHGDIADCQLVADVLRTKRPTSIVHLAAESHVDRSIDGPAEFLHTNVVGTFTLLEAARHYCATLAPAEQRRFRFLHVSTDEVFGTLGPIGTFHEQSPYAPRSPYSATKAAADHLVRSYHATYGLPTLITNCSNNFGPYQFPEKLIPLMTLNALEGKPLPVYGDGLHVRDWLYVEDHCRALRIVLDRAVPGDTYNIGANCQLSNLEVVRRICQLVDVARPSKSARSSARLIRHVADRPGHDRRYGIDATKLQRELGWKPDFDFQTALAHTVHWYLENGEWVERVTTGKYQRERLGLQAA
ncbi:MAG: dTDP-glucose 4,6-dehydratase [Pirellulales bacterium]|nr:dTDP-glucose 4,6-dehydratase [Pirellulales bacterium]